MKEESSTQLFKTSEETIESYNAIIFLNFFHPSAFLYALTYPLGTFIIQLSLTPFRALSKTFGGVVALIVICRKDGQYQRAHESNCSTVAGIDSSVRLRLFSKEFFPIVLTPEGILYVLDGFSAGYTNILEPFLLNNTPLMDL